MKEKIQPNQNLEQEILAAAEDLFLERGYARTSAVEIAKRVGCNQALVHYYFRTKENLFNTIFVQKNLLFLQTMESFEEQDLPFEEMISRFIKMQFNFFITHDKRLAYFILDELVRNPVRLDSQLSAMKRLFKSSKGLEMRLQKEIAEGRVRKMTFFDLAVTIITLNSALFVSRPIIIKLLDISEEEYTALIKLRCQENIEIILRSLRP